MGNAAVLFRNLADAASVRAGSQLISSRAINVQNAHVARKWRSQIAEDYLLVDFGGLTLLDTVAAIGITANTWRVRLSSIDSSGLAGNVHDTGVVSVDQDYRQAVVLISAPVSARYLRVDLVGATGTFVEVGRLVAGTRNRFTINFSYGWTRGYVDPSIRTKTRGGQTQVSPENAYRVLDVTFETVFEAQRYGFVEDNDRLNGMKTDVLFIVDDQSVNLPRDSVWGLVQDLTQVGQSYFSVFSKQYRIEERL